MSCQPWIGGPRTTSSDTTSSVFRRNRYRFFGTRGDRPYGARFPIYIDRIPEADIRVAEFGENQAQLAFAAHRHYRKGSGHPAQLNILDCCTYALAAEFEEPVLFKGGDFDKTDMAL